MWLNSYKWNNWGTMFAIVFVKRKKHSYIRSRTVERGVWETPRTSAATWKMLGFTAAITTSSSASPNAATAFAATPISRAASAALHIYTRTATFSSSVQQVNIWIRKRNNYNFFFLCCFTILFYLLLKWELYAVVFNSISG